MMSTLNNPFGQPPSSKPVFNPFAAMTTAATQQPVSNPFAQPSPAAAFASTQRPQSKSPFLQDTSGPPKHPSNPFATIKAAKATPKPQPLENGTKSQATPGPNSSKALPVKGAAPKPDQVNGKRRGKQHVSRPTAKPQAPSTTNEPSEFATRIYTQLAKDGIQPPVWPKNAGIAEQKNAMAEFREAHRKYREKARASLMKADLIDDPDKRRRLDDALVFKGICEEMCPEWEKITRITENDVWGPEKEPRNGQQIPTPQKMVKRLARSAAGQEAPLPMDVRSPAACRRALDYLLDDLIRSDDRLPSLHHFVWDRSRAIRIDLSMQAPSMGPDEIREEIYCLETIARFHATSVHLLSQTGLATQDYSEQQEVEQLSKTLMSLRQRYKDCADMGIVCENEAEFRAYYVLFFAWDPSLKETIESWGEEIATSNDIQTALCMVEAMQNTSNIHGPLNPFAPTEIALNAAAIFFSVVASPHISYTMACIAELHFSAVRRSILKIIVKAYARPKEGPKDVTPEFLRHQFRFDTEEEAVSFVEQHGLVLKEELGRQHLVINPRQHLKETRLPHSFSQDIVERKRSHRPLPEVIHETVYEAPHADNSPDTNNDDGDDEDSLFVQAPRGASMDTEKAALESELEESETTSIALFGSKSSIGRNGDGTMSTGLGFGRADTPGFKAEPPSSGVLKAGGLSTTTSSSGKVPEAPNPEKKVTFGGNSYKIIEARTNAPPSTFNFLSSNDNNTAPPTAPINGKSSTSSWFPGNLPGSSEAAADGGGASIFSGLNTITGSSFTFPGPGASPATSVFPTSKDASSAPSTFDTTPSDKAFGFAPSKPSPAVPADSASALPPSSTVRPEASAPLFSGGNPTPAPTTTPYTAPGYLSPQATALQPTPGAPLTPTSLAPAPSQPKEDPFDNLTRWFVSGDRGLMEEQLESWVIQYLLQDTWETFRQVEDERKKKEEDEQSWAEARKFRTYSLQVTYFYRWLDVFRKRRVIKRIQIEKEKARKWRMSENVANRESAEADRKKKKEMEAVELLRKSAKDKAREDIRLRESVRSPEQSVEEALLASGIFNGVRDERAAARHVARDDDEESSVGLLPSEMLYQRESRRRQRHGLPPLNRLGEVKTYKEGSKTAKLRALSAGGDSLSISTGSMRNSAFSSSYRSSLGLNSSRVAKMKKSRVTDPYWRMKAHGLVQMPNGDYLHESLAKPMLRDGKRYAGFGDFGLPPTASEAASQSPPAQASLFEDSPPLLLGNSQRSRVSMSPSIASNTASKRKRIPLQHDDGDDGDLAAYRSEASAGSHKRAKSGGSIAGEDEFLAQMESLLQDVETEGNKLTARQS
ncbi:SAC3/GANP/Nin1/mts3/eIF-3 p25 family-domain-containing protein [Xylariales sp. AK1849]|nr:SAC3/GANP/Nin1/mts3/eIF-3 p25 family-domain-containing protein [Xylariales sp. AK1849]